MIEKPEDLIGKWFSNFFGMPDEYTLFLDTEPEEDDLNFFRATSINLRRSSIRYYPLIPMRYSVLRSCGLPLLYERTPELRYVTRKTIRYIFEKALKR